MASTSSSSRRDATAPAASQTVHTHPDVVLDELLALVSQISGCPNPYFRWSPPEGTEQGTHFPLFIPDGLVIGQLELPACNALNDLQERQLRHIARTVAAVLHERTQPPRRDASAAGKSHAAVLHSTGLRFWNLDLATGTFRTFPEFSRDMAGSTLDMPALLTRVHPEDRPVVEHLYAQATGTVGVHQAEFRVRQAPHDEWIWVSAVTRMDLDVSRKPRRLVGLLRDLSAQRATENELREREAQLRAVVELAQDAIYIKDRAGRYLLTNPAMADLFGVPSDALLGRTDHAVFPAHTASHMRDLDLQVIQMGAGTSYETALKVHGSDRVLLTTQSPYWIDGQIQGVVGISRDMTTQKQLEAHLREEQRALEARVLARSHELQRLTSQLQHDALHDAVTGLPNRAQFMDGLSQAMARAHRDPGRATAVLYFDIDRLQLVNDSLGYAAGDCLLAMIARRLQEGLDNKTIARLGNDEFVVILEDSPDGAQIAHRTSTLLQRLSAPFPLEGQLWRVTLNVGILSSLQTYTHAEHALRDASIAMDRAKTLRTGEAVIFEPWMRERRVALATLQRDLTDAADRDELHVQYQPIVDLHDGKLVSCEALIRWTHPVHGPIAPAEFIPLAEESDLICDLDFWVLREACLQARQWVSRVPGLRVSVNLSARHFNRPGLATRILAVLDNTHCPPSALTLEITEGLLMQRKTQDEDPLEVLRAIGVQIAVDDFGTGYCSLRYLRDLPLDTLKIDRSFVQALDDQPELLGTIMRLAQAMNLHVVAEGIETSAQLESLRQFGCDSGQGYLFARPMDAAALESWQGFLQAIR